MTTTWSQGAPYNDAIESGYNLGCTTIAAAQIMNYHKYPNSFQWALMPDALTKNDPIDRKRVLTLFLKDVHDKIGVNNDGGANINDVKSALESYGYKVSMKNHVDNSYSIFPMYCRGSQKKNDTSGHAWVCDGSYTSTLITDYELYMLDISYGPQYKFGIFRNDRSSVSYPPKYHMNWGWGGSDNGWFMDGHLSTTNYPLGFNYDRKDFIIKK